MTSTETLNKLLQENNEYLKTLDVVAAGVSRTVLGDFVCRDCILPDTIYIHLDEGLGIGIICNGSLLTGSHNRGGEINHMPLGEKDRLCGFSF